MKSLLTSPHPEQGLRGIVMKPLLALFLSTEVASMVFTIAHRQLVDQAMPGFGLKKATHCQNKLNVINRNRITELHRFNLRIWYQ